MSNTMNCGIFCLDIPNISENIFENIEMLGNTPLKIEIQQ